MKSTTNKFFLFSQTLLVCTYLSIIELYLYADFNRGEPLVEFFIYVLLTLVSLSFFLAGVKKFQPMAYVIAVFTTLISIGILIRIVASFLEWVFLFHNKPNCVSWTLSLLGQRQKIRHPIETIGLNLKKFNF